MILSDGDIQVALQSGALGIDPLPEVIQPSSVDLRLGPDFRLLTPGDEPINTADVKDFSDFYECRLGEAFAIGPGDFVLGQTLETVRIPHNMAAKVEGKSSLGRLGLMVHVTAGFIDPGFEGTITLEMSLVSPRRMWIYPGMKISQLCLFTLTSPARNPYGSRALGSRYQGQDGPTASRYTA